MLTLCSYPDVLCVGAITREYTKASYSNYGDGVDVWAAGDRVNSASKNGDSQYSSSFRGSSFAAPQVSGIIASFIGYEQVSNDAKLYSKLLEQNWHPEALDFDNKRLAQTGIDHPKRGKDPYYRPEQTAMDTISQGPDKDSDGNYTLLCNKISELCSLTLISRC
jgi:subtilisin family serine protease